LKTPSPLPQRNTWKPDWISNAQSAFNNTLTSFKSQIKSFENPTSSSPQSSSSFFPVANENRNVKVQHSKNPYSPQMIFPDPEKSREEGLENTLLSDTGSPGMKRVRFSFPDMRIPLNSTDLDNVHSPHGVNTSQSNYDHMTSPDESLDHEFDSNSKPSPSERDFESSTVLKSSLYNDNDSHTALAITEVFQLYTEDCNRRNTIPIPNLIAQIQVCISFDI